MSRPTPSALLLRDIESQYQMSRDEVRRALQVMQTFGAVETYTCDRDEVRAALRLSVLHRLKTIEVKQRWRELAGTGASDLRAADRSPSGT